MAPLADGLLIDAPIRALRAVCSTLAISARHGSGAHDHALSLGHVWLSDDPDDAEGPLAGVRQGLIWAMSRGASWLATAPCDAPHLHADHYRILQTALEGGAAAVFARSQSGIEPLVAIWPTESGLAAVSEALKGGRHPSIRDVLTAIDAMETSLSGYDGVNVNHPVDLPSNGLTPGPA